MGRSASIIGSFAVALLLVATTFGSCSDNPNKDVSCIMPANCTLHIGDVVLRRGSGLTSRTVLALDEKGEYSHVGIVVDSAGVKMVVHAVPDEPDYEGDPDRVKMDTPEQFFSSVYAQTGEVCRYKDSLAARKAAAYCGCSRYPHWWNRSGGQAPSFHSRLLEIQVQPLRTRKYKFNH